MDCWGKKNNHKNNPKNIINKKQKKNEPDSQENKTWAVVNKWQDKREILTLSTNHSGQMIK